MTNDLSLYWYCPSIGIGIARFKPMEALVNRFDVAPIIGL